MKPISAQKLIYPLMATGALVGFVASFLQMLEKITLLKNAHAVLSCNLSSVFNCSNILNAHQSSVFGFPNSLLCITFFAITFAIGLAGWTGSVIHKNLRLALEAIAVFFVGFGFWYFWQSIFNVGSLCVYCIFCYAGVLTINWAWLRLNISDFGLSKKALSRAERYIKNGADTFLWCLVASVIALEALIKFSK